MTRRPCSIPVPPLTDEMYECGKTAIDSPIDVIGARYDTRSDSLELKLRNGVLLRIPRAHIWEFAGAMPADLRKIEVQPGGDGISVRKLDVDISVPGLIADELRTAFAKAQGRKSRGRTSAAKAAASRKNGRKGGRPRKRAA